MQSTLNEINVLKMRCPVFDLYSICVVAASQTFNECKQRQLPVHIRPLWLLVPRVFETTSYTSCEISMTASLMLSLLNTALWFPKKTWFN